MALIVCPECKHEVSDQTNSCPHCGYPLNREGRTKRVETSKSRQVKRPIDPHWQEGYKTHVFLVKLIWGLILLITIVMAIVGMMTSPMFGGIFIVFIVLGFFVFIIWISVMFTVKVRVRDFDGYVVMAFLAYFSRQLIIDGTVVTKSGSRTRFLYGSLPDGRTVCAAIASDGEVKFSIESDETKKR